MQLIPEKGTTEGLFTTCSGGSSYKVKGFQVNYQMFYKHFYIHMLSLEGSLVLTRCVAHSLRGAGGHPLGSSRDSAHIHCCFAAAAGQEGRNPPIPITLEVIPSFQEMWSHAVRLLGKYGFAHRGQEYQSLAPSLKDCFKFSLGMGNCAEPQEAESWWMVKSTIYRSSPQLPTQIHCLPLSNIWQLTSFLQGFNHS